MNIWQAFRWITTLLISLPLVLIWCCWLQTKIIPVPSKNNINVENKNGEWEKSANISNRQGCVTKDKCKSTALFSISLNTLLKRVLWKPYWKLHCREQSKTFLYTTIEIQLTTAALLRVKPLFQGFPSSFALWRL